MKKIAAIPTLCTLGNAACGFAAIIYAAHFNPNIPPEVAIYYSGWFILAAMVFDALDGYLARLSKTTSEFGVQLDSLCDAVSFGVAPAFVLIQLGSLHFQQNRLLWDALLVVATLYMLCAILRLARFNVQKGGHQSFRGLPSPAAAGCIASLALMRYDFKDRWFAPDAIMDPIIQSAAPLGALIVALLMVSRVSYPHAANQFLSRRRHSFSQFVSLIGTVAVVLWMREPALVLLFWFYALLGPARLLWRLALRRQPSPVTGEQSP